MKLANRIAVVTGGASGIGAACAAALAQEGAKPVVWDLSEARDGVVCDVSDPAAVARAIELTCQRYGTPSLLVAAAGTGGKPQSILEMDVDVWDRVLAINLRGVMLSVQAVARKIVEAGLDGSIVSISSVNGVVADWDLSAYSASKAAVYQFTRVVARELGPYGVRINAIGPGPTDTPMSHVAFEAPAYRDEILRRTPLGEVGAPEMIAEAVVNVMKSGWITGQGIMADGGSSLCTGRSRWTQMPAAGS
jgi:NAD(P)-dependent dehydrogenase (short-subunit alcohol dehydrogenase family)